jgi:ribose transport system ATP-binding protein
MLILKNLIKTYPGVVALNDVSMEFEKGEVHALLGENGAGKTTLIKIIAGAIQPDSGTIAFNDQLYGHMTPNLAKENGVAVMYQDINLVQGLSVSENIFLGRRFGKMFNPAKIREIACKLFAEYGFDLDPSVSVSKLSAANMQLVEICKAISNDAKIMIMDEPTAPLATNEVDLLFSIIRRLKEKGVTVIYISHRLDEVFSISDRISVLRDGCYVCTLKTTETNRAELITKMVGRKLNESYPSRSHQLGEVVLKVDHLTGNSVEDINFELHSGEILGFAGLVGSGRTETVQLITGYRKATSGDIFVKGKKAIIKSPADAIKKGIGLIPEDRKEQGCILFNTMEFNTTLISLRKICRFGFINEKKRRESTEYFRKLLDIRVPSIKQMVINLSGGNQQKVVLSKTLAADLEIVIFDEPTKGIDVGSKQEIYRLMNTMAAQGKAIIMISSEMEEILGMSDRIVILHEGMVVDEISKEHFSQENVLRLASGITSEA